MTSAAQLNSQPRAALHARPARARIFSEMCMKSRLRTQRSSTVHEQLGGGVLSTKLMKSTQRNACLASARKLRVATCHLHAITLHYRPRFFTCGSGAERAVGRGGRTLVADASDTGAGIDPGMLCVEAVRSSS